jgi:dolichol kinase
MYLNQTGRMERHRNEKLHGGAFGFFFFAALATIILTFHAPSPVALAGLAGLAILLGVAAIFCAVRIAVPLFQARLDLQD